MKVYKGRLEVDGRLEGMDYPTDWEIAEATTVEARYVVAIHHTFLGEKWFIRAFEDKQEAVDWCGTVVMDEEVNIGIIFHNNGRYRWYVSMVMEKEKRNEKEDSINNLRKEVYKMDKNSLENYAGTDLQLCVRSYNLLKRAGINTIQELYELSLIDLYGFCRTENGATSPVDYIRLLEDITYLFQCLLIKS